jgi:hypothetical protein
MEKNIPLRIFFVRDTLEELSGLYRMANKDVGEAHSTSSDDKPLSPPCCRDIR